MVIQREKKVYERERNDSDVEVRANGFAIVIKSRNRSRKGVMEIQGKTGVNQRRRNNR